MEDQIIISRILNEFDVKKDLLDRFRVACERLVEQILESEDIKVHKVTSRVKDRDRLEEKLKRADKEYQSLDAITDTLGIRIITHFEDEVDRVGTVIEREFSTDTEKSVDKRKMLDPDRFGYLSLHYICSLNEDRCKLPEYRQYELLTFEVQIRSILQHAWAEIEHDLGYKTGAAVP
ncbi:MAG: RelA/SpoT domain-containing protein, partial [Acidobacteriia bacterium]|nr:RelA/SpoT domain-containing protein [Terriglobia bacterium]